MMLSNLYFQLYKYIEGCGVKYNLLSTTKLKLCTVTQKSILTLLIGEFHKVEYDSTGLVELVSLVAWSIMKDLLLIILLWVWGVQMVLVIEYQPVLHSNNISYVTLSIEMVWTILVRILFCMTEPNLRDFQYTCA